MVYLLRIPKVQLAAALTLIYLSSLKQYPIATTLIILITSVGFAIFFDSLFTFLKSRAFFMPWSALVSGLIIALVIDPNALWYQVATICALSMAFKNFIRIDNRHIFNPAAIGLFLGGVVFNLGISWWGASFQVIQPDIWSIIAFLILLFPAYVSFFRMKRYGSILSFLITYALLSSFQILSDPTSLFFALVMLPEPMTSPYKLKKQIFYGAIVATVGLILSHIPIFPDILIPALLLGNLLNFFFK